MNPLRDSMFRGLAVVLGLETLARLADAHVAGMRIDGAIDPITAEFVVRGMDMANGEPVHLVRLRMDTPGGFGASVGKIIAQELQRATAKQA